MVVVSSVSTLNISLFSEELAIPQSEGEREGEEFRV